MQSGMETVYQGSRLSGNSGGSSSECGRGGWNGNTKRGRRGSRSRGMRGGLNGGRGDKTVGRRGVVMDVVCVVLWNKRRVRMIKRISGQRHQYMTDWHCKMEGRRESRLDWCGR